MEGGKLAGVKSEYAEWKGKGKRCTGEEGRCASDRYGGIGDKNSCELRGVKASVMEAVGTESKVQM